MFFLSALLQRVEQEAAGLLSEGSCFVLKEEMAEHPERKVWVGHELAHLVQEGHWRWMIPARAAQSQVCSPDH